MKRIGRRSLFAGVAALPALATAAVSANSVKVYRTPTRSIRMPFPKDAVSDQFIRPFTFESKWAPAGRSDAYRRLIGSLRDAPFERFLVGTPVTSADDNAADIDDRAFGWEG